VWGWSRRRAILLLVAFLTVDIAFVALTITKIVDGGWVPVLLAAMALAVMMIWRRGQRLLTAHADTSTTGERWRLTQPHPARGIPMNADRLRPVGGRQD